MLSISIHGTSDTDSDTQVFKCSLVNHSSLVVVAVFLFFLFFFFAYGINPSQAGW